MLNVAEMPMCALLDGQMRKRCAEIIAARGITTVVETGIDKGGSTMLFSDMAQKVIGIDNDPAKVTIVRQSVKERGITNVSVLQMNSPDALRELVRPLSGFIGGPKPFPFRVDASKTLFLLDAHWQSYWPLKDEIKAIPRGEGVLVMHDARVPGCPTLGVDAYDGQELSYEYLQDVLTAWSPTHVVEYNDDTAEVPRRGVMYVYPGPNPLPAPPPVPDPRQNPNQRT